MPTEQPSIGVFDSGIGGLSVLRELQAALPGERFVYWADSGHAPYGERSTAFVRERSHAVVQALREQHRVKAVVIACNTATAAAIDSLRAAHPDLPIVGIEPALKPAAAQSRTGHVGVLATRSTLASDRFQQLAERVGGDCHFHPQPCDGLADAIEQPAAHSQDDAAEDGAAVRSLIRTYVQALGPIGGGAGAIDTLVLGCTHYPLAWSDWVSATGAKVQLIDPAAAVARQLRRVLAARGALSEDGSCARAGEPRVHLQLELVSTGELAPLQAAVARWASPG